MRGRLRQLSCGTRRVIRALGATTPPEEDRAMAALLATAESRLSGEGLLKLQGFYEKAILAKN